MNELIQTQPNSAVQVASIDSCLQGFSLYVDSASPRTTEAYLKAVKQLIKYLQANGVQNPTKSDIIAYREYLKATGHKPTTVQNYITAARIFFRYLSEEGLYPNIAEHVKGAKLSSDHKKDYLTKDQIKAIIATMDTSTLQGARDYAIFVLMVTCGLRTIEVSRANIEDLRTAGDSTVLYIQGKGKSEKSDYVKISAPVERAIRRYLAMSKNHAPGSPLFTSTSNNSKGRALTTRSVSGIIKSLLVSAGYDSDRLTAHSLRHTAVTLSLLAGKDITEVQQFARHANIATTMIYNHAIDKAKNTCSETIANVIF